MTERWSISTALACMLLGLTWASVVASDVERPLRTLRFSVAESAQKELAAQLREFADSHAFAMRVGETRPDGRHIIVQMSRADLKAVAVNPIEPGAFHLFFYKNDKEPPLPSSVDALIAKLRSAIGGIQGLTFSEDQ